MPKATVSVSVRKKSEEKSDEPVQSTPDSGRVSKVIDLRTPTTPTVSSYEPPVRSPFDSSQGKPLDSSQGKPYDSGGHNSNGREYQDEEYSSGRDVPTQEVHGILDIAGDGHGFLRPKFRPSDADVYISASQIRKFMLRGGDEVEGLGRPPKETERYYGLLKVVKVNGIDAEKQGRRVKFEDLTSLVKSKSVPS